MMNPAPGGFSVEDDVAQALPFCLVLDATRDPEMIGRRQVHEIAAGERDVRRDARALGAEGLLGDLNQDLVAAPQALLERESDWVHRRGR